MVLVVLLHKPPEHTFIVCRYLWQAVSVKEKELFPVTVDNDRLCSSSAFQHTVERFIYGYAHADLSDTAFCFRRVNMIANPRNFGKLVVYVD